MYKKKWLTRIVVLLVMIAVVITPGLHGVLAKSVVATQPVETGKTIEVELYDDYFDPKDITIPNGKTTTILLKNKGKREHTFTVKELGIDAEVQPGQEKDLTVKPNKSGTYELICRYHFRRGMVGKVIVN